MATARLRDSLASGSALPGPGSISVDDPRLIDALEHYLTALESGHPPDLGTFLSTYPDISDRLSECLAGLEAIRDAGAGLSPGGLDGPPTTPFSPSVVSTGVTLPLELGDFELIREVGRGGMGLVYEARQISLGRKVALKVLPFAATLDPRQLQRFKTESLAAACLQHPHIVPLYSVGFDRGVHHYAMQFIDGRSLLELIAEARAGVPPADPESAPGQGSRTGSGDRKPDPACPDPMAPPFRFGATSPEDFRWIARLGIQAAEGLDHAHALGILHRDVKPANLMVNARGHLWVTDFGLARVLAGATVSRSGDIIGTLRYMSPEQALARRAVLDHRADVYSLGATLYEAMTLGPLFECSDNQELVRKVIHEAPRTPRLINPAIPRELETIVLKALSKEPEARYGSAQEMAEDLRRFVADLPIRARRPTPAERLHRWARRHKPLVGTAAAMLFLALGVLSATTLLLVYERIRVRAAEQSVVVMQRRLLGMADEIYQPIAEEWIALEPDKIDFQNRVLAKALGIYESFAREQAGNPTLQRETAQAFRKAADIHYRLGHYTEAGKAYEEARGRLEALGPVPPPVAHDSLNDLAHVLNRLARLDVLSMKYSYARRYLERAVAIQEAWIAGTQWTGPRIDFATYLTDLGQHYALSGRDQEAELIYNRALAVASAVGPGKASPNQPPSEPTEFSALESAIRSRLHRTLGAFPEAAESLRQSVELYDRLSSREPSNADYRRRQADSLLHLAKFLANCPDPEVRDTKEAVRLAFACVAADPQNATQHIQAAQILVDCGSFREAESLLSQVVDRFPDRADALNNLAWLLVTHSDQVPSDPERAIRLADEAVRIAPDLGIYWNTLGASYFRSGDYKSAVASLEKSMSLREGGDSFDWFFLAMAHFKLGDRSSALRLYAEAVHWMDSFARENHELTQFRREADALLQI